MNRVFQNRALVATILDKLTLTEEWSANLALNSVTLRWKRNWKGNRDQSISKIMFARQDQLDRPDIRPWMDFLEEMILSLPFGAPMTEPPVFTPFTCLTRLYCWYIHGMQFPETLLELELNCEGPDLSEEIAFPPGLERLYLGLNLLDCLGPVGLPRLESLRVRMFNPSIRTNVYHAKRNWPPSLKSISWSCDYDVTELAVVCSKSWLDKLPNLTCLSDVHFRIEDIRVLPETLLEYDSATMTLLLSFSGFPNLTNLTIRRWGHNGPDHYTRFLEQVHKTLKVLNIGYKILKDLPALPQLDLLHCSIEPGVLPLLNQRVPRVRFLVLNLLLKEDLDLDCSLFPRSCRALIIRFDPEAKPCKIRIHGSLPESLEFLSLTGSSLVLECPLPPSIQRLEMPKYLLDPIDIPNWVLFSLSQE